ncbi:hypothetical protein U6A24_20745 [Aquimarina gracilis]|uniref:Bacteriocin-like protein n=1 Tax=Aquimarina gracilis TaxID=874422 RepID=A0ABU6A1E5_9FLAO|nr:hypothetical protein [Aquimarina gracilis]MEB3347916.1 hypothetical protein [Aquimarina gracilis]
MLKNLSNLGTILSKQELQSINAGFVCYYWDFNSYVECASSGADEIVECEPTKDC